MNTKIKNLSLKLIIRDLFIESRNKITGKNSKVLSVLGYVSIYIQKKKNGILAAIPNTTINKNIKKIKQFQNIHDGERCFIIGSGPSLKVEDLELIKDEYSFAVNHIYHVFKQTSWRPTFYYSQEINLKNWKIHYEDLINCEYSNSIKIAFFPINRKMKQISKKWNCVYLPVYLDYCELYSTDIENFSIDCSKEIVHAYTSLYSVLQIAVYMGFKEIYLLGVDGKYLPNKIHFYEKDDVESKIFINDSTLESISKGIKKGFIGMKNAENELGTFTVINCTKGGYLDIFPKKDLKDVINSSVQ